MEHDPVTIETVDRLILSMRRHLKLTYAAQAFQCLAGAFNTWAAISLILENRPLFGGLQVLLAFWMAHSFNGAAQMRGNLRTNIAQMHEVRARLQQIRARLESLS